MGVQRLLLFANQADMVEGEKIDAMRIRLKAKIWKTMFARCTIWLLWNVVHIDKSISTWSTSCSPIVLHPQTICSFWCKIQLIDFEAYTCILYGFEPYVYYIYGGAICVKYGFLTQPCQDFSVWQSRPEIILHSDVHQMVTLAIFWHWRNGYLISLAIIL